MWVLLVIFFVVKIGYWWWLHAPMPTKVTYYPKKAPAVTLIICYHNEINHLPDLYKQCLGITYQPLEIILMDDGSSDGSYEYLKAQELPSHIRVLTHDKAEGSGKKGAFKEAVQKASHDIILATDADCNLIGNQWVQGAIMGLGLHGAAFGMAPFKDDGLLARFCNMEHFWVLNLATCMTDRGYPYWASGRNWTFDKTSYLRYFDQLNHHHLKSGDDDMVFAGIGIHEPVTYYLNPEAATYSTAPKSLQDLIRQRHRHMTTAVRLPLSIRLRLALFHALHLGTILLTVSSLFLGYWSILFYLLIHYVLLVVLVSRDITIGNIRFWWLPMIEWVIAIWYLILIPYLWRPKNNW